ncbi:MAG TPA: peptide chain release factor N(5)-glutamine methyltransferase [Candidatus Limnocylindria bacterium]|nr:peptide chain release factor N(5)-glutamine methyltransferase [Candidatus Limnocylindria bacterium]
MTVLEIIQRSTSFLEGKGVESPRLQIELMLAHALDLPRLKLYLNFDRALNDKEVNRVREMVKRRGAREPLQHILGSTSFCGLEIKCSPAALIPRPETELLAERGWQFLVSLNMEVSSALDLGTGTGCIAIAITSKANQAQMHAVDISAGALALARENATNHHVAERITFHLGDAFAALPSGSAFNLIVSNPPYIPAAEISTLEPEVRDFDPKLALDGGEDGLDFYRRIAKEARAYLKPHGKLMLEFGDGQAVALEKIFSREKWIVEEIVADYSPRPRILIARLSQ